MPPLWHLDAPQGNRYSQAVRTTLTIDTRLLQALKRKAAERNVPVKSIIDEALRHGLEAMDARPEPQPYRTRVYRLGLRPGIDPDRVAHVAQEIDDEEAVGRGR
jgi:hypothetical protein